VNKSGEKEFQTTNNTCENEKRKKKIEWIALTL